MSHAPSSVDDRTLLAAFRAGRVEAFEMIVRRHYPGLLLLAEQRCGGGALAEDVVQTALVRAHRFLQGSKPVENLGAWLRRVVYNCATDLLKTERRDRAGLDLAARVAAPTRDETERTELRRIVAEGIEKLPAIYRDPLTLRYLHGVEAREVAARLGDNLNSVKSRIARGRRELRRLLESRLTEAGYLE